MDKPELLILLQRLYDEASYDCEQAHIDADEALLKYINDLEITKAFNNLPKWYA